MITFDHLFIILKPTIIVLCFFLIFSIIFYLIKKWVRGLILGRKFKFQNQYSTDRQMLDRLRDLSPSEFEGYIGNLYRKLGYDTKVVGGRSDGGIDVIADKDGVRSYIQCKRYKTSTVSVHDVRDFYGALVNKLTNSKGVFVTTNIFSKEAELFSEGKPIELLDGFKLIKLIKLTESNKKVVIPKVTQSVCPKCGSSLILKSGKYGEFYGCTKYPICKFTKST